MAELTPEDMSAKLMAPGFERSSPIATVLSDPIADTPMMVTLDQLRPYEHDPRVMRNPAYDEIKASIRERGLDAPPTITRRPGEAHYIIRNGGNTRLAVLRELWSETREERFFRIPCLFKPWPPVRGEIVALTGHLAENELRGNLTFIERALGVEKAREFYEQEVGQALSQSELARRLSADGFAVPQPHISRMQDTVRYLLPAIPSVLYGGLGRHQVERLAALRKASERTWEQRTIGKSPAVDFDTLFQDVLIQFDSQPQDFSLQRVRDELVGQMADLLEADYDALSLAIDDGETRQRALTSEPTRADPPRSTPSSALSVPAPSVPPLGSASPAPLRAPDVVTVPASIENVERETSFSPEERSVEGDFWHIEPALDTPEQLRIHIAQCVCEIADEAMCMDAIDPCTHGVGFVCRLKGNENRGTFPRAVLTLLHALSAAPTPASGLDAIHLASDLGPLLHGYGIGAPRLSGGGLAKLFRLLCLARRLAILETGTAANDPGDGS
jgi:ParB family protein of integrating conjugative element (PFGI_1 class)